MKELEDSERDYSSSTFSREPDNRRQNSLATTHPRTIHSVHTSVGSQWNLSGVHGVFRSLTELKSCHSSTGLLKKHAEHCDVTSRPPSLDQRPSAVCATTNHRGCSHVVIRKGTTANTVVKSSHTQSWSSLALSGLTHGGLLQSRTGSGGNRMSTGRVKASRIYSCVGSLHLTCLVYAQTLLFGWIQRQQICHQPNTATSSGQTATDPQLTRLMTHYCCCSCRARAARKVQ